MFFFFFCYDKCKFSIELSDPILNAFFFYLHHTRQKHLRRINHRFHITFRLLKFFRERLESVLHCWIHSLWYLFDHIYLDTFHMSLQSSLRPMLCSSKCLAFILFNSPSFSVNTCSVTLRFWLDNRVNPDVTHLLHQALYLLFFHL